MNYADDTIVVRGAGDLATGVIRTLWRAGFKVAALELPAPLTIRRSVAVSTAVSEGLCVVEDITAAFVPDPAACAGLWAREIVPVLADPAMRCLKQLKPITLVDAIIAKRNTGMRRDLAPITVALGPGFTAPDDADCVVETMRGHDLGRLITSGAALPNTGIPGELGGRSAERVIHAPCAGLVEHICKIGDRVAEGEALFSVGGQIVCSRIAGTLRGLIARGTAVRAGTKCADVDPRPEEEVDWRSISDKARALGGAVLEACFMLARQKGLTLRADRHAAR